MRKGSPIIYTKGAGTIILKRRMFIFLFHIPQNSHVDEIMIYFYLYFIFYFRSWVQTFTELANKCINIFLVNEENTNLNKSCQLAIKLVNILKIVVR